MSPAKHADKIFMRYAALEPREQARRLRRHARLLSTFDPGVAVELAEMAARVESGEPPSARHRRQNREKMRRRRAA